jgi:hypothetical protein
VRRPGPLLAVRSAGGEQGARPFAEQVVQGSTLAVEPTKQLLLPGSLDGRAVQFGRRGFQTLRSTDTVVANPAARADGLGVH